MGVVRPLLVLLLLLPLAVVGLAQPSLTRFAPSYGWQASDASLTPVASSDGRQARESGETPSDPGRVTTRRLNRAEYNNTIRDLLGVDVRPADDFPQDDSGYGFDNIGDVLSLSPALMEKYVTAAERVARLALFGPPPLDGDGDAAAIGRTPRPRVATVAAEYNVTGLSLPNAFHAVHRVPVDGDYVIRVVLGGTRPRTSEPITVSLWIDQQEVRSVAHDPDQSATFGVDRQDFGGQTAEFRVRLTAGDRWLSVAIPRIYEGLPAALWRRQSVEAARARRRRCSHRRRMPRRSGSRCSASGSTTLRRSSRRSRSTASASTPSKSPGRTSTRPDRRVRASRRSTRAVMALVSTSAGVPCASSAISRGARSVVRSRERELEKYVGLVRLAERQEGSAIARGKTSELPRTSAFTEGLAVGNPGDSRFTRLPLPHRAPLRLASLAQGRHGRRSGGRAPDHAARAGDAPLVLPLGQHAGRRAAPRGGSRDARRPAGARRRRCAGCCAIRRRARSRSISAASGCSSARSNRSTRDRDRFPDFEDYLRLSMRRETELFVEHIVREDRSILDFIDGRYSFLNERLARHYGIAGVSGPEFRRVDLTGSPRGGVLTQASVLTVSSYATRTSPVLRGKWILDNLLNTPPPEPPADVPNLDEATINSAAAMREQLEAHRKNPTCASCHRRMDPLGFGLENFDAVGAWRTVDGNAPVDASGVLPDGRRFTGPEELRTILKADREAFARALTSKLLTYALGRGLERYDTSTVRLDREPAARTRLPVLGTRPRDRQQPAFPVAKRSASAMIVTRRHLPRRTFLKGMGAVVALPVLDAMTPAFAKARRAGRCRAPRRLAFTYVPNGVTMADWTPKGAGRSGSSTRGS